MNEEGPFTQQKAARGIYQVSEKICCII